MQRDYKFWAGVGLALMSFAPDSLGVPDGLRSVLFFLGVGLVAVSGIGAAIVRWGGAPREQPPERPAEVNPASNVMATRTAFDSIQSIKTLPTSLGGNDVLRLGTLATLRRGAPYSLGMITLELDTVAMRYPSRADGKIAVEDLTVTKGSRATYVFDAAENKRHEISVAGRTYIVTLLESKRLDTPGVNKPIEWVFGITEK